MREILIYDGDCGFCSRCVRFIERHIGTAAQILPWQQAPLDELGISEQGAREALQWLDTDRRVSVGAAAVARLLIAAGVPWSVAGRLLLVPGLSALATVVYRLIADNRSRLPGGTAGCGVPLRNSGT